MGGSVQGATGMGGGEQRAGRCDKGDQGGGHVPGARRQDGRRREGQGGGGRHRQEAGRSGNNDRGEDIDRRGVPGRQVHHHGGRVGEQAGEVRHRRRPAGAHPLLLLEGQARAEHELSAEAGFPTFGSYGDPGFYGKPSMEYPGLIKISKNGGPPCDPDGRDWAIGTGAGGMAELVARWIDEVMPGHVDTTGGPVLCQLCMCCMTPDEDFVIDFLDGKEFGRDVVVGAGFSGHGFKMGPAVGKILA